MLTELAFAKATFPAHAVEASIRRKAGIKRRADPVRSVPLTICFAQRALSKVISL
jgi:hypothetical protein